MRSGYFTSLAFGLVLITASSVSAQTTDTTATRVTGSSEQVPTAGDVVGGHPQTREGFWFNAGLGIGSLGCEDCGERENGLSGGVLLGVGTTGWAKSEAGETLTVGTLDARLRFYPARKSGFFVTGGLGLGAIRFAGESEYGLGLVLGVGWDIRVGRNVSLTPFYNGFAMRSDLADANVGQLGIGITIH
jgi:hypothetical protein